MTDSTVGLVWGHVNLNVRELERSIDFYQKLGFEVFVPAIPYLGLGRDESAPLPEDGAAALGLPPGTRGRACIMQLDAGFPKLDLTEWEVQGQRPPLANRDLGCVRICLASRDLESDYARLQAQGVPFLSEPRPGKDGLADVVTCADPDGTLIELIEIHLEKWTQLLTDD